VAPVGPRTSRRGERTPEQGVVSHRSAASLYGLGHLPADRHEFTIPRRRQTRRPDVTIHVRKLSRGEWTNLAGLPVTRPSGSPRTCSWTTRTPRRSLRSRQSQSGKSVTTLGTFAYSLAPHAASFGLRRGDGLALLRWLLGLVGDPETPRWVVEAREHVASCCRASIGGLGGRPPRQ